MAYIGQGIKQGTFAVLDTSGNTYNGSNTTFSLGTQVGSAAQLLVSHDGVIQKPGTDYTLASGGTQITFSTAPASGASIFIVEISGAVGGPLDSDLNGSELILDTDGDTSITADTDDQIDIKVAGTDQITIKDGALSPVTDNDIDLGTSSLEFKDAFFDGTVTTDGLTVSGTPSFADGSIAIADLDIDGGTDIGADIADADLFIIDDGAGGTNRKVAASRLKTYAGGAGLNHIITTSVSSGVGNVAFLNGSGGVTLDNTYNMYLVTGTGVGVATDDTSLNFRVTVDGGSNYNAQIYLTHHIVETTFGNNSGSSGAGGQSVAGNAQLFAGALGAYAGENVNFEMKLFDVGSTSNKKAFTYVSVEHQYNNIVKVRHGGGIIAEASNAIDGIRWEAGSGNITEGEFSLYGIAKS